MDNRFRFLYCIQSELQGRRDKAWAGNGKTGASTGVGIKENPYAGYAGVKRSEKK